MTPERAPPRDASWRGPGPSGAAETNESDIGASTLDEARTHVTSCGLAVLSPYWITGARHDDSHLLSHGSRIGARPGRRRHGLRPKSFFKCHNMSVVHWSEPRANRSEFTFFGDATHACDERGQRLLDCGPCFDVYAQIDL